MISHNHRQLNLQQTQNMVVYQVGRVRLAASYLLPGGS